MELEFSPDDEDRFFVRTRQDGADQGPAEGRHPGTVGPRPDRSDAASSPQEAAGTGAARELAAFPADPAEPYELLDELVEDRDDIWARQARKAVLYVLVATGAYDRFAAAAAGLGHGHWQPVTLVTTTASSVTRCSVTARRTSDDCAPWRPTMPGLPMSEGAQLLSDDLD